MEGKGEGSLLMYRMLTIFLCMYTMPLKAPHLHSCYQLILCLGSHPFIAGFTVLKSDI